MILIGENIHIVSQKVKFALEHKEINFIEELIRIQSDMDAIDLNVGPAKGKLENIFEWLGKSFKYEKAVSFDSSNIDAIEQGLNLFGNSNSFINSASADCEKLQRLSDLAVEYGCNLIALAMNKEIGIPKTTDERLELVFGIYEKCIEKGIDSKKLFFDPLILPLKVDQSQALEALNTIRAIKESFEPPVNTLIGLSNISNGIPKDLRPLVNRVFGVLAFGAGLDAAIVDAKDSELYRIFKMLETNNPKNERDFLYINLSNMVKCFGEIEDIDYDKNNLEIRNIMKTAKILLGKTIYSDSFTQV